MILEIAFILIGWARVGCWRKFRCESRSSFSYKGVWHL